MRIAILPVLVALLLPAVARAQGITAYPCVAPASAYPDPSFSPLPGARVFFGAYEGGRYQIEIPANWNGDLVVFQHGGLDGTAVQFRPSALREHWIRSGYAWAHSTFRCNGDYGIGLVDTVLLPDIFASVNQGRRPNRIFAVGASNGGYGTILAVRYYPQLFAGGLALCSAGIQSLDVRIALASAAAVIAGTDFAYPLDVAKFRKIFGTPENYTPQGRQLASVDIELTGGSRPFAMEGLAARFEWLVENGLDDGSERFHGGTNRGTVYRIDSSLGVSADLLNQKARRVDADPQLRVRGKYEELLPFDGRLERPLLTLHGTGDLQIPITNEREFRRAAERAGKANLLVQRIMRIPGHCQFSEQEQIQAFDDLVKWVKEGTQPEGDDVMADLRDVGRKFTTPIRPGDPGTRNVIAGAERK